MVALAQHAGTNYYYALTVQMAAGKTFAQAAVAAGQKPVVLPPFSLSTAEMPELGDHATIDQIKQAAFTTDAGHISSSCRPAKVVSSCSSSRCCRWMRRRKTPRCRSSRRRSAARGRARRSIVWLQTEANRELTDTPLFKQANAGAVPQP